MAGHQFWRVLITANNGDPDYLVLGGVDFLDAGSKPLTGSGTASASSQLEDHPASLATDGDGSTYWEPPSGSEYPQWLQYDFGAAVEVAYVSLSAAREDDRAPKDFQFQYSDDGQEWVTDTSVSGETGWDSGASESRSYALSAAPPAAIQITKAVGYFAKRFVSKANVSAARTLVVKRHNTKATLGSISVQTGATFPRVGRLNLSLDPSGNDGETAVLKADQITAGRVGAMHTGQALAATFVASRDYPNARVRALLYTAKADGSPGALVQVSEVAVGVVSDTPTRLAFKGKPRVDFGNYFIALWSDTDISIKGQAAVLSHFQNADFGSDPGLKFDGVYSGDRVPYVRLLLDQNAKTRIVGTYSGRTGGNDSTKTAADILIVGRYYNLDFAQFQAAYFEAEDQTKSGRFRIVVFDEQGRRVGTSNIVEGATDSAPNVATFPSALPLDAGPYYVGVLSDSPWSTSTFDTNAAYDTKSLSSSLNAPSDSLDKAESTDYLPIAGLLQQDVLPITPALKSPLLQIWT